MTSDQIYGVTPPMNVYLPTEHEKHLTDTLIQELKRENTFETPAGIEQRKQILNSLGVICDAFVKLVAREREPKNDVLIRNATGKIFTYGSYLLEVYGPGSDIDALVVAPRYVERGDYFKHFPTLLQEMAPKGAITDLSVVTGAFVPIIKFEYSGISIDLIFSRVMQKQLPADFNLSDNGLLRGLDDAELRSVNGNRVTSDIINLVPEKSTFRMALRAIKLWAQRRAVYANIMGFPGGVAWAMLVARVCQLYPKAAPSVIVNKFFLIISQWQWPQPVLLKPIENGPLNVRVWNPKAYKADSFHLMPIITPSYPSMNSTFNITKSGMIVIQRELKRALEITELIMADKKPWSDLFAKHTFFTSNYKYYISVIATSETKEAHKMWSGYVESKVRMLVQKLETHQNIALAHPFNKGYERRHRCKSSEEIAQVQEGSLAFMVSAADEITDMKTKNEPETTAFKTDDGSVIKKEDDHMAENGQGTDIKYENESLIKNEEGESSAVTAPSEPVARDIFTTTHYIGLQLGDAKSLDLSYQVDEFKSLCTSWQDYKDHLQTVSSIGIQHCRNFDLPDDVFEPDEKKPQRVKKSSTKSAANGKKREASEDQIPPAKRQQPSVAAAG